MNGAVPDAPAALSLSVPDGDERSRFRFQMAMSAARKQPTAAQVRAVVGFDRRKPNAAQVRAFVSVMEKDHVSCH